MEWVSLSISCTLSCSPGPYTSLGLYGLLTIIGNQQSLWWWVSPLRINLSAQELLPLPVLFQMTEWRNTLLEGYLRVTITFLAILLFPTSWSVLQKSCPNLCLSLPSWVCVSFFHFSLSRSLFPQVYSAESNSSMAKKPEHSVPQCSGDIQGIGTRLHELEAQACHVLAVWPWASYLISLFLIFLICNVMIITVFISHSVVKIMKYLK